MPVSATKASSVGRLPFFLTSMYSGQFDQLTTFSVSDRSAAVRPAPGEALPPLWLIPWLPQPATAATPSPARPSIAVRRVIMPRTSAVECVVRFDMLLHPSGSPKTQSDE